MTREEIINHLVTLTGGIDPDDVRESSEMASTASLTDSLRTTLDRQIAEHKAEISKLTTIKRRL